MQHPTHIVAIGASAGGLEALRQFFSVKLEGTSLAFVIIQHISPTYKSLMPELMSKVTDIPVVTIQEEQEIEAGYIYLIPRGYKVRLDGWKFVTEPTDPLRRVLNLPINIFFKSAADTHKELVIGVILSGTGSDGALGLQRIHEVGGLALVQAPETAQFDGMPRAALDVLRADFILHPKEMIPEIVRYAQGLPAALAGDELSATSEDDETLTQIFRILGNRVGIDYSKYKLPTLARRIEKRMKLRHVQSLVEYADLLTVNPDECHELAKDFLINVTQFFRDPEFFDVLYKRAIIPMVRNALPNEMLRVWVPACATGEEAYTLAMLILEAEAELQTRVQFKIFATDLDSESIQVASRGVYPMSVVSTLPEKFLNKYFAKREASYVVDPLVRERILFAPQDLIHSPPFRKLNLVSCRNVLIYFQHELQMEILRKFHYSLVPGGFLFLGSSESVSDAREEFEVIYSKGKIFKKIGASHGRPNWSPSLKAELQLPLQSALVQNLATPLGHATINVKTVHFSASLMEAMLAPGVVINSKNMIVHFVGDVSHYFAHPVGEASFEALRLIRPQFKAALRSATFKLFSPDGETDVRFEVRKSSSDPGVLVVGRRFVEPNTHEPLAFVRFQDVKRENPETVTVFSADAESNSIILELEHELERTRDRLQNSIEALEITNEELHSTNEELLSANEELQSTNEELQSVNEELHTVNSEHQMKIEELIELNSDLDNLLAHTDIGVLFLDEKLNVRKYTQAAKKYIHIMERDVGRSIRHLAIRINFPTFVSELETVLSDGCTTESKIYSSASDVVLVRIVPYKRSAGVAHGVTVIFINVDYQSEVVERLSSSHVETICRLFHLLPMPAFVINDSGVYIDANQRMLEIAESPLVGLDDRTWLDEATCSKLRLQENAALHSKSGVSEIVTLVCKGAAEDYRRVLFALPQAEMQSPRLLIGVLLTASDSGDELELEGFEHLQAALSQSGNEARPTTAN